MRQRRASSLSRARACAPAPARRLRRRGGFSVVEVIGVLVIGVLFTAFAFDLVTRQLESSRAQELAFDLRLLSEAGRKYVEAEQETLEDIPVGPSGAREVCISDLVTNGFLSRPPAADNPYGLSLHLTVGRLPSPRRGEGEPAPPVQFMVTAFTQGNSPTFSAETGALFAVLENLGDLAGFGAATDRVVAYGGIGRLFVDPNSAGAAVQAGTATDTYEPVWEFEKNTLALPRNLTASGCGGTSTATNLSDHALALRVISYIPPSFSGTPASLATEVSDMRKLKDAVGGGSPANAYLNLDNINAGRVQALRLEMDGAVAGTELIVRGDIRVPALRIKADELYLDALTVTGTTTFGRTTRPGDSLATPPPDPLRYQANRTLVDSIEVGEKLIVEGACGDLNRAAGDNNACAPAQRLHNN